MWRRKCTEEGYKVDKHEQEKEIQEGKARVVSLRRSKKERKRVRESEESEQRKKRSKDAARTRIKTLEEGLQW